MAYSPFAPTSHLPVASTRPPPLRNEFTDTPAFVGEPACNGCAERFMRTLKEQCLYLHQFRDLEEAREIIGAFIARYNTEWIVERLGYRTPAQARRDALKEAACGDTSSSSGPGVQDTGCATAFACVPTMRYAANRAWRLLSVLAFNLMVVFSSRPRPWRDPQAAQSLSVSRPYTRCPTSV